MGGKLFRSCLLLMVTMLASIPATAEPRNLKALVHGTPESELFPEDSPTSVVKTLPDGVQIGIGPGAQVQRAASTNLLLGAGSRKTTLTHVYRVLRGRVAVTIPDRQLLKVAVLLIGPNEQSGVVRGGHSVALVERDHVRFATREHAMLVGKGSYWRTMDAGQARRVDIKTGQVEDSGPLPAPQLSLDRRLMMALTPAGSEARVHIVPIPRAVAYQVALLSRTGEKLKLVAHTKSTTPSVTFKGNVPGNYVVVARALDATGLTSELSSPLSLRVMGVTLPVGAEARATTVFLHPNQRLPLVKAEGMRMTYGTGKYFIDAPNSIGLARESLTTVRFRDPSTKEEAELVLAPRFITADVDIGPVTARWPEDQLRVEVTLRDATGAPFEQTRRIRTLASVNSEPISVRWRRNGSSMSGAIQAPAGSKGPWVVRVEVKDQTGAMIGRDFLEVIGSGPKGKSARSTAQR